MAIGAPGVVAHLVAAIAFTLGAGSLLLFGLFLWAGSFALVETQIGQNAVLIWDAWLCCLFFFQHSGMVRRSFRKWLLKIVPEYCHGVVYTISSAVALLLLVVYWQPSTVNVYAAEGVAQWVFRGVLLLSLAGFVWGIRSLEEFDAFGIQAFLRRVPPEQRRPAKLTIVGPYRLVRHPFYFSAIVAVWSTPALTLDRLVFSSLFTAWILVGARLEERDLAAEFGESYRLYQRAVPMIIPRLMGQRGRIALGGTSVGSRPV